MIRRCLRTLRSDERGAAIIELAIIAPVLALMTIGVVDMSNAFSRKLALEQGAQRAIEKVMQTTGETTVEDTIKTEAVCQVDGVNTDGTCKSSPITTANVTVTLRQECTDSSGTMSPYEVVVNSSTDTDTFDNHACASGTVTEAHYIQVGITDTYTPLFPIHFGKFNGSAYPISATAGMRTK